MNRRVTAAAGLAAVAGAAVLSFVGVTGASDRDAPAGGSGDAAADVHLVAAPSSSAEPAAAPIPAEPGARDQPNDLVLTAPATVQPGTSATFGGRWLTPAGERISGEVDLQRIAGNSWSTIASMPIENGVGELEVQVKAAGIYRLAYGGSDEIEATVSDALVVIAGEPLASRLTATAENTGDGTVSITAAWTTEGGVPIVGDLSLEQFDGNEWVQVSSTVTGTEGTAVAETTADKTARFRFAYPGGTRFAPMASNEAMALGDDVRTIPVELCYDHPDLDVLPEGVGCHYTPVTVGTFVAAHDYLGNAWWNSIPIGSYVELTGELPGLYEVVERVMAPGRGSALGSATKWTCDDECDVILQTCQGKNTGFTWLRRVSDVPT